MIQSAFMGQINDLKNREIFLYKCPFSWKYCFNINENNKVLTRKIIDTNSHYKSRFLNERYQEHFGNLFFVSFKCFSKGEWWIKGY